MLNDDERHDADYFGSSTKIVSGRGLAKKTMALREAILAALSEQEKPVTIRQAYYLAESAGAVPKSEKQGYRPVQRQLLAMRREGVIPYDWIADLTRWRRKPNTGSLHNLPKILR